MGSLFITNLFSDNPGDRFFYLSMVVIIVVSIVLHELAHGWMALKLGDETPRREGRMTGNPLVHMGPWSLLILGVFGIAWGQMPIDASRLRGRYGSTWVALAGPLCNLLLAFACTTALGLWLGLAGPADAADPAQAIAHRGQLFLQFAAFANVLLFAFNLLPIPPLDGSHVASDCSPAYRRFVSDPGNQGILIMGFFFAFVLARPLVSVVTPLTTAWLGVVIRVTEAVFG